MIVDMSFRHVDGIIIEQPGYRFQAFSRRSQSGMVGYTGSNRKHHSRFVSEWWTRKESNLSCLRASKPAGEILSIAKDRQRKYVVFGWFLILHAGSPNALYATEYR